MGQFISAGLASPSSQLRRLGLSSCGSAPGNNSSGSGPAATDSGGVGLFDIWAGDDNGGVAVGPLLEAAADGRQGSWPLMLPRSKHGRVQPCIVGVRAVSFANGECLVSWCDNPACSRQNLADVFSGRDFPAQNGEGCDDVGGRRCLAAWQVDAAAMPAHSHLLPRCRSLPPLAAAASAHSRSPCSCYRHARSERHAGRH